MPTGIYARTNKHRGKNHHSWKGDKAGYYQLHLRVRESRGRPDFCEKCGLKDPTKKYEWASLTKNYTNPRDYIRLCIKCHRTMDSTWQSKKTHCKHGHEFNSINTRYAIYNGYKKRVCNVCHRSRMKMYSMKGIPENMP